MGYISKGLMYLSPKAQTLLSDELKLTLEADWDIHEEPDIWSFDEWKWYSGYADIALWEDFYRLLAYTDDFEDEWDVLIVGEDGGINDEVYMTQTKFYAHTTIGIL